MAPKRHFTGRPLIEESNSEDESDSEIEDVEEKQVRPVKKVETLKSIEHMKQMTQQSAQEIEASEGDEHSGSQEESEEEGKEEADSGSETGSSESESDSDESSEEEHMLKPVFLSKKHRIQSNPKSSTISEDSKERTLRTIEHNIQIDLELKKQQNGTFNYAPEIDDTDDLDPEVERAAWELRQLEREKRDRERIELEQDELEELEERRLRTEEEREQEAKKQQEKSQKTQRSAFFQDDDILKRNIKDENIEAYDKRLLPQRYDPKHK